MMIHSIEFENYTTGQKIKKIQFDKINLLVGGTGAGKTQILKIISSYVRVASQDSTIAAIQFKGYFKMGFSAVIFPDKNDEKIYQEVSIIWEIHTDEMPHIITTPYRLDYGISEEHLKITNPLTSKDTLIIDRTATDLKINGISSSSISPEQSVFTTFSEPIEIAQIRAQLFSIITYDQQLQGFADLHQKNVEKWRHQAKGRLTPYVNAKPLLIFYSPLMQIDLVRTYDKALFNEFLFDLQNIFPTIEDIKMDLVAGSEFYNLHMLENGKWIPKNSIAGGILKTVYLLAVIKFNLPNNVILLDELENSLGINCLDEITDYILNDTRSHKSQFILTSHHPYIISHIKEPNWLIISQNNGVISAEKAHDVGITSVNNLQDLFFQLINYIQGQSQ